MLFICAHMLVASIETNVHTHTHTHMCAHTHTRIRLAFIFVPQFCDYILLHIVVTLDPLALNLYMAAELMFAASRKSTVASETP
jgi:hypothetical protein